MPEIINGNRWISLREAFTYLGVILHPVMRRFEYRYMFVRAIKVGKLWRFNTADVDEWVRISGAFCEQEMI